MKITGMWISCHCCNGIRWGGWSPEECDDCYGLGRFWISFNDRLKVYPPNGPFLGQWPGQFQKQMQERFPGFKAATIKEIVDSEEAA